MIGCLRQPDTCCRDNLPGIRTGRGAANALWTRALDGPHLFGTPDSEMKPSESNSPTYVGRGTWDAFE